MLDEESPKQLFLTTRREAVVGDQLYNYAYVVFSFSPSQQNINDGQESIKNKKFELKSL
jgi:hypothetical protein